MRKTNLKRTINTKDPPTPIKNAMAELSSLSQRWSRASKTESGNINSVKNRFSPTKFTKKKTKHAVKKKKGKKKWDELIHADAVVVTKKRELASMSDSTVSASLIATATTTVPAMTNPSDPDRDRADAVNDALIGASNLDTFKTTHKIQTDLVGVGKDENNPIKIQHHSHIDSDGNFPVAPSKLLMMERKSNDGDDCDEEMEISDDEDGDGEQGVIDHARLGKEAPKTCSSIIPPTYSDTNKTANTVHDAALALSLKKNDLAEKKLRLAMAHKRKALAIAKAKLLRAQLEKEEVLKANSKQTEAKENVTAFSMKSLVIQGISTSGPAHMLYPNKLENGSTIAFSAEDSNADTKIKNQPDPSRSSSPTEELKTSLVEAEKLKLNLELAKRKLKLKTLLNAKAKKKAEHNQESSSSDELPKCVRDATAGKTPSEIFPVGQQKETAMELRRRQDILRESIKQSKETNKELKDDKEIRELRELVEKQRRILQTQGAKISNCTKNIQQHNDRLEQINALKSESEVRIENLMKKRALMEKMISSVSRNIIHARRKRMKLKKNLNANNSTKRI